LQKRGPSSFYDALQSPAHKKALLTLIERASLRDVTSDLEIDGHGPESAAKIANEANSLVQQAVRRRAMSGTPLGVGLVILGASATLGTYTMMKIDGGGSFIIWYGAVIWGFVHIARSANKSRSYYFTKVRDEVYELVERGESGRSVSSPSKKGSIDY
jgi:hypothetical protein